MTFCAGTSKLGPTFFFSRSANIGTPIIFHCSGFCFKSLMLTAVQVYPPSSREAAPYPNVDPKEQSNKDG